MTNEIGLTGGCVLNKYIMVLNVINAINQVKGVDSSIFGLNTI